MLPPCGADEAMATMAARRAMAKIFVHSKQKDLQISNHQMKSMHVFCYFQWCKRLNKNLKAYRLHVGYLLLVARWARSFWRSTGRTGSFYSEKFLYHQMHSDELYKARMKDRGSPFHPRKGKLRTIYKHREIVTTHLPFAYPPCPYLLFQMKIMKIS